MLGESDTAAVASVCKAWEEMSGDGSNASKCSITPASIFDTPHKLLGMTGASISDPGAWVDIVVWGGLAYLLFMSNGKGR